MEKEYVSIVMLSYNHENYIAKALDSVLMQQTKYAYKIVIGDDCSPDHTRSIIQTYVQRFPEKFRAYCRKKNLGMNQNFVHLIHHCKGKYIAFLECDDYWTDNQKLQRQIDFLEHHPEYSAVTAQTRSVDSDNKIIRERMYDFDEPVDYGYAELKAFKQPGHMSTWLMRNQFQRGIFDIERMLEYKHSTGDRILPIILLAQGKIRCFPEVVSAYRFDLRPESSSWSSRHEKALLHGNLEDFQRLEELEHYADSISYPVLFTRKKAFYYGLALYYAYIHHNKEYKKAKKDMVHRMHHNPLFILSGYHNFIQLIINSIKLRYKKPGKDSNQPISKGPSEEANCDSPALSIRSGHR